jgi:hypothetical protein
MARLRRETLEQSVEYVTMGKDAGSCDTHLTGVEEDRACRMGRRLRDIDIRHDDDGRLAAQFKGDPLECVRRRLVDEFADSGRTRERNLIYQGMTDESIAGGFAEPRYDVEYAVRHTRFGRKNRPAAMSSEAFVLQA